ncbi:MAG: hypothetical protein HFJ84_10380 [Clostridiales bacterium]|jgi:hypothetical protein|nr:hypothetical protein [Clostridiales bacterium]
MISKSPKRLPIIPCIRNINWHPNGRSSPWLDEFKYFPKKDFASFFEMGCSPFPFYFFENEQERLYFTDKYFIKCSILGILSKDEMEGKENPEKI